MNSIQDKLAYQKSIRINQELNHSHNKCNKYRVYKYLRLWICKIGSLGELCFSCVVRSILQSNRLMTTSCMHFCSVTFWFCSYFVSVNNIFLFWGKHACSHGSWGGFTCHCKLTCFVLAKMVPLFDTPDFHKLLSYIGCCILFLVVFWKAFFLYLIFGLFYFFVSEQLVLWTVRRRVVTTTGLMEALKAKTAETRGNTEEKEREDLSMGTEGSSHQ